MFKKGMWIAMGVAGILSLACVADAGDMMIWSPRTPAGGGPPAYLGSYLSQAAAVEYGPSGIVNRQKAQKLYYETETTFEDFFVDPIDPAGNYVENMTKTTTVQKQESTILYPDK